MSRECLGVKSDVRLKDRLKPEELNDDWCVMLLAALLRAAASEYQDAKTVLASQPNNKDAIVHVEKCRRFYLSEYFANLTGVNGQEILDYLDAGGKISDVSDV